MNTTPNQNTYLTDTGRYIYTNSDLSHAVTEGILVTDALHHSDWAEILDAPTPNILQLLREAHYEMAPACPKMHLLPVC